MYHMILSHHDILKVPVEAVKSFISLVLYRITTNYLVSDRVQVRCANLLCTSILMFGGLGTI